MTADGLYDETEAAAALGITAASLLNRVSDAMAREGIERLVRADGLFDLQHPPGRVACSVPLPAAESFEGYLYWHAHEIDRHARYWRSFAALKRDLAEFG